MRAARDIEYLSTELVRVLDDAGTAVGPWHPHLDPAMLQVGLRHMLLTRIFDDRMQRTQRAGQDFLLHALPGRGGRGGRAVHGAAARRHAVPVLPQSGTADRARHAARRPHVPAAVEHARHVQGPAAAGDVSLEGRQHLLDLRQPRHAVPAGGGLGDGGGDQGRGPPRRQLDRRGQQRGSGLPSRAAVRLGVPGAGHSQRGEQSVGHLDVPGLRRRRAALLRGARPGLRHRRRPRRRQ